MKIHFIFLTILCPVFLLAQDPGPIRLPISVCLQDLPSTTALQDAVPWVYYTDDYTAADVVVSVQNQSADDCWLLFTGQRQFKGHNFSTWSAPDSTISDHKEQITKQLVQAYKTGLLPYLNLMDLSEQMDYTLKGAPSAYDLMPDPWKQWLFQISGSGSFFLSKTSTTTPTTGAIAYQQPNLSQNSSIQISRITPRWRLNGSAEYSSFFFKRKNDQLPGSPADVINKDQKYYFSGSAIRSLNQHWSMGAFSVFGDLQNSLLPGPIFIPREPRSQHTSLGIEYNAYPYRQYFHRRLLFGYNTGTQTRIFKKIEDYSIPKNWSHQFSVTGTWVKNWGYIYPYVNVDLQLFNIKTYKAYNSKSVNAGCSIGRNIGKRALIYYQVYTNYTQLKSNSYKSSITGTTNNIGLNYYFGARTPAIVNPRMLSF